MKITDYNYIFRKTRAAWNTCYKLAIPLLLNNEDYGDFAVLGLYAMMEVTYALVYFRETGRNTSDTKKVLQFFFGPMDKKEFNVASQYFVNPLRHSGTTENWWSGLTIKVDSIEVQSDTKNHWVICEIWDNEGNHLDLIRIFPQVIWERCHPKIDAILNEYELDESCIPESYGGRAFLALAPTEEEVPQKFKDRFGFPK